MFHQGNDDLTLRSSFMKALPSFSPSIGSSFKFAYRTNRKIFKKLCPKYLVLGDEWPPMSPILLKIRNMEVVHQRLPHCWVNRQQPLHLALSGYILSIRVNLVLLLKKHCSSKIKVLVCVLISLGAGFGTCMDGCFVVTIPPYINDYIKSKKPVKVTEE